MTDHGRRNRLDPPTQRVRRSAPGVSSPVMLANVLASAPDFIYVLDDRGIIEYANHGQLPGMPSRVVGTGAWEHIGSTPEQAQHAIDDAIASGTTVEHELQVASAAGPRWLRVRMRPLPAIDGVRVVVFVTDITSTRQAQLDLEHTRAQLDDTRRVAEHAQRLESLGRLAGGVAHDFNNLLTSIISFSRFVMDDLAPNDPRRSDLAEVLRAADSATRLTSQLLAFSRKRAVEPRRIDLAAAIATLTQIMRRVVGERVQVDMKTGETRPWAVIDPGQLDQLLMNLAVNARDAMPDGGTLTVAVGETELTAHPVLADGRYATLTVSDTGCGMSEEVQRQAFEPFFTTKGEHGTGLGLATCYGIVKQAGGHIDIASERGRGTRFTLLLPLVGSDEARSAAPAASAPAPRAVMNGLALVVEDQTAIRATMSRTLKALGFQVLEAGSAEEAIALVNDLNAKLDLLVTDVVLPGLAGTALAEQLRKRTPQLRVLVCSGYVGVESDALSALQANSAFLAKPFTGRLLTTKVSTLFQG